MDWQLKQTEKDKLTKAILKLIDQGKIETSLICRQIFLKHTKM
jgi:hypothetical protein